MPAVDAVAFVFPQLVTFDARGVSGHPNHTSIFRAVRQVPCYGGCVHLNVRIPWEWMVGNCVPVMAITLPSACAALLHRINNTTTTPNRGMLDGSAAPQAAAGDGDGSGAKPCHVYTLVGSLVARVGRSSVSAHGGCGDGVHMCDAVGCTWSVPLVCCTVT